MSERILVTGATGFVGGAVARKLAENGFEVLATVRSRTAVLPSGVRAIVGGELEPGTDWAEALAGVSVIIHAAARVHVMRETATDALAEFRRVNVEGTAKLANDAAAAGVRRFIFLSSVKVNGEQTEGGHAFGADDTPAPEDPYGISKWEAEQALARIGEESGMEVVSVRPPLVYGPGVKANFLTMMRWLSKGVPLPFGAVHNQRSLVALVNLIDFIITCLAHPAAADQTFLVADGEDLSTTELLRRLGDALGKPAKLIPVPAKLIEVGAAMIGKRAVAQRLCGSLQVDVSKAREVLGWVPPVTVDEALTRTVKEFQR